MPDDHRPPAHEEGLAGAVETVLLNERPQEADLRERIEEFERLNRLVMAREQRILDLKTEANELARAHGKPLPYHSLDLIEADRGLDDPRQTSGQSRRWVGAEQKELHVSDILDIDDLQTLLSGTWPAAARPCLNIDPTHCLAHIGATASRLERAKAGIAAAPQQMNAGNDCAGSRRAHATPIA